PDQEVVARQVLARDERIAHSPQVPGRRLGHHCPVAASADLVAPRYRQPQRIADARVAVARLLKGEPGRRVVVAADVFVAGSVARLAGNAQLRHLAAVTDQAIATVADR